MDRGAWKATVYRSAKDGTWLRDPAHIYVYETSHKISSLPDNAVEIYQARKKKKNHYFLSITVQSMIVHTFLCNKVHTHTHTHTHTERAFIHGERERVHVQTWK